MSNIKENKTVVVKGSSLEIWKKIPDEMAKRVEDDCLKEAEIGSGLGGTESCCGCRCCDFQCPLTMCVCIVLVTIKAI